MLPTNPTLETTVFVLPERETRQVDRDQLVLEHLPLVRSIAIRVYENLPVHVDVDDLVHAGIMGLFDAAAKYKGERQVSFHAYAKHRIKGAILDSLRQMDWASRDLRKRQKQVDAVTQDLSLKLGRMPDENEMAGQMGMSVVRWRRMQVQLRTVGLVAANPAADPDRDLTEEYPAAPAFQPDRMCEHRQLQSTLARAMSCLPERYQKVVFLYYTNDMTMKEIGDLIGVNESRVSQIHKTALKKMAVALQSEGIHSAEAF